MLRIGAVQLQTNLVLAPIAGHCDLPFRLICRRLGGVGLASTDLINPEGIIRGKDSSLSLARSNNEDHPLSIQLYGSDPEKLAAGAEWAQQNGADVIDLNMGCPVDKVTKKDGGSMLLCKPDLAESIVKKVLEAAHIPVTVKMRLGWDENNIIAPRLAQQFEELGVAAITIHGRTTEQRFRGSVNLDGIKKVVQAVRNIPVIGNGDISSPEDAQKMISYTGCSGVMIGRAALGKPWIFRETHARLTGSEIPPLSARAKLNIIRDHFRETIKYRGERKAVDMIRHRISSYGKSLGHVKPLKEAIRLAPDAETVFAALDAYINDDLSAQTEIFPPGFLPAPSCCH